VIAGLDQLDMSEVTSAQFMFYNDVKLTSVDFGKNNFSKVTDMYGMFLSCALLTNVNVSDWQTGSVTDMGYLFSGCQSLKAIDVASWDVSSVTNMDSLFFNCKSLTTLPVDIWNVKSVTSLISTFTGCSGLNTIPVDDWQTSSVTDLTNTFSSCAQLATLNLGHWDTSQVKKIAAMFASNTNLVALNGLDNWDTSQVTSMASAFSRCQSLTTIPIGSWNVSKVTDFSNMFSGCSALSELSIGNWNTSQATNLSGMFFNCMRLTTLTLDNWNTSSVLNMTSTFSACNRLTTLSLKEWDTSNVTSYSSMLGSPIETLTLGAKFTFHNSTAMGLSTPSTNKPYTGKWQLNSYGPAYTSAELMTAYDGATMAGTYIWEQQGGNVTVSYVDEDGRSIADKTTLTGSVGETYQATPKTISGYILKTAPNNEQGTFTATAATLTYVYAGQLSYGTVPSKISFGNQPITNTDVTLGAKPDVALSVQDNRSLNSQWQLSAQLSTAGFVGVNTGDRLTSATLYYQAGTVRTDLVPGQSAVIRTQTTTTHNLVNVSQGWSATNGLLLKIPAGAPMADTYQATVTWSLNDAVLNN